MKPNIPHPIVTGYRFQSLEDLRRAVSDIESQAREYGVHPDEVLFSDEFIIRLSSEKLTDGTKVLNLGISIAQKEPS